MPPPVPQRYPQRLGKFMITGAWLVVLALLTLLFDKLLDDRRNPNRELTTSIAADGVREVILQRNPGGHYVASGAINGYAVEFLVDTGASDVAIPANIADRIGLQRGAAVPYRTANGTVTGYLTRLDTLTLGDIELRDVRASISPHSDDIGILLGMSVLKRIEFTQRGDSLILRQTP